MPPRQIPLTPLQHTSGRQAATCEFRCGNACAQPVPNRSDNPYFGDVVAASATRRAVVTTGLTAAVLGTGATLLPESAAAATTGGRQGSAAAAAEELEGRGRRPRAKAPFGFTAIEPQPAGTDELDVPDGFSWHAIIAWGDPLFRGTPRFDVDRQSASAQRRQFGYNCDYVGLLPTRNPHRAVLVVNHEYTNDNLMFEGYTGPDSLTDDQLEIIQAAHGMSVVEVRRRNATSGWTYVQGARLNRRIHTGTRFTFDGPGAGSDLLRTSADPDGTSSLGTLNNCAGGTTPWGTVLSGEENFNQYFVEPGTGTAEQTAAWERYGIAGSTGRGWERIDPRFDLGQEPNEANRLGWVVEIDPLDPHSTPVKHTAMGRFKHEGANVTVDDDGSVVAYMGDDERFDYLYKFVSHRRYRKGNSWRARRHNKQLLSSGDLYVARFTGDGAQDRVNDGTGEWIPLVVDNRSKVPGMNVEEVLVHTRLAADKVGPTKMDRPEDVEVNPVNGRVYAALTNNSRRTAAEIDEANPRPDNRHGHVLEITPTRGEHVRSTFSWKLVLIAGDPDDPGTYFNGYDRSEVSSISCPDNVAFDGEGNLWIATDGNALGDADGMYLMPLEGREKGHLQRFLSVPAYAECCGPLITFDQRSVLAAIQHPGESDAATYASPASLFPYKGDPCPRPGVVEVRPDRRKRTRDRRRGHGRGRRQGDQSQR